MVRKLLTNNNTDRGGANFVYREDDGYIKSLKHTHICFVVYMMVMTILFYVSMGLWSIDFDGMFVCDGSNSFYPKNLAGQFVGSIKNITIIGFSCGINWFFWLGERLKRRQGLIRGKDLDLQKVQNENSCHGGIHHYILGNSKKYKYVVDQEE